MLKDYKEKYSKLIKQIDNYIVKQKYLKLRKDINKLIYKIELNYNRIIVKSSYIQDMQIKYQADKQKKALKEEVKKQDFPSDIKHIYDIKSGSYIKLKPISKKENIYKKYKLYTDTKISEIKAENDFDNKYQITVNLYNFLIKVDSFSEQNVKNLNKELKKVDNIDDIKTLIMNYKF